MDLSIIIVSWNVKEKLRENLKSLINSEGDFSYEIIVIDNDSKDGTIEMIKNEFPRVKYIANNENIGFARANNKVLPTAAGDYILLLNPDMKVHSNTLINISNWMRENEKVAVAGCHLVDISGKTIKHVRKFPKILDQLAIVLKLPHIFPFLLNGYIINNFDYSKQAKVDSIRGGFFMINPKTIERLQMLLKFDERYFLWFEEVDFCREIKKRGGEVWYTPSAECVDLVGQSFSQVSSLKKQKYFRDSMLKYFKKWHPYWQYLILKIFWVIGIFITLISEIMGIKNKAKT